MLFPEAVELVLKIELLAHADEQPRVPLLGSNVLASRRQVQDHNSSSALSQARGGAHHQGALTHLPRVEYVAELPFQEGAVELFVRAAAQVAAGIHRKRAARDVESARGGTH